MRKLLFALIATISLVQSAHAITSELNQSINIYDAILNAASSFDVIGQNEFIVDIEGNSRNKLWI